ncbi:CheY-like chemotaxis protein, response regulator receiver [Psychromonas ingrahamii 37]|uniref:CheY-like chemotaxis protein, response regulator receiver n=1 Tax=Psychromonas ingrahamii (strain DSM 17664 / CCUG 51855 / 37) TaxID=357804 RepID=A1SX64_PSYIN|nr:response regulator [Psychromonas ingrahamii]ABM04079.1 CheY-like chemotaxis protein, response regulator receiver [Psychromonas ingrahamii 37]
MEKINIICVDDERDVLESVSRDLDYFSDIFNIEECESAFECLALLEEFDAQQKYVALIISDHIMPEKSGVELLTEVAMDNRFLGTKKLLLTGLATQADTIDAINNAKIDNFLEKVWDPKQLLQMVKKLLTEYIIEKGIGYEEYIEKLDAPTLYRLLKS